MSYDCVCGQIFQSFRSLANHWRRDSPCLDLPALAREVRKLDVVDVILAESQCGCIIDVNGQYTGQCPRCRGEGSFHAFRKTGGWSCDKCHRAGDVISFANHCGRMISYRDRLLELAARIEKKPREWNVPSKTYQKGQIELL